MKKKWMMACLLVAMMLLTGCTDAQEPFQQKEYSAEPAEARALAVDLVDRRVEVKPSADGMIHISYWESRKEFCNLDVADGVLTLTAKTNKSWQDYFGGNAALEQRTVTVYLPADMQSVSIRTTNEDIVADTLAVEENVELHANRGSVLFGSISAGNAITLESKNGSVKGGIAGHYEDYAIACHVKKGNSNLPDSKTGGAKLLTVNVNNGDADIDFITAE